MASSPSEEEEKRRQSPPPVEFLKPGETQAPAPPANQSPAAWVPRPEEYQRPTTWSPPAARPTGPSNLPRIAGVLLLIAAILGMASAVYSALTTTVEQYANFTQRNSPTVVALNQICGLLSIWSQAMALLGGVMALQRMNWKLTLVCAILSLGTLGFYFEASVLGLIALFFTIRARPFFLN